MIPAQADDHVPSAQPQPAAGQPERQLERVAAGGATRPPRVDSGQLFEGQRELIILHQGEEYRLRITRQEKLILTK